MSELSTELMDTIAALREELATMTALYEAATDTQTAEYVNGLVQHRTQVVSENESLRQRVKELEQQVKWVGEGHHLTCAPAGYTDPDGVPQPPVCHPDCQLQRAEILEAQLAAVTQELENEKQAHIDEHVEDRKMIAAWKVESERLRQRVEELEQERDRWYGAAQDRMILIKSREKEVHVMMAQRNLAEAQLAAVTQELENEKRSYAECFEERRRLIAQRDALQARLQAVEGALRGIVEIGKRDMSNSKYDAYFEEANAALRGQREG